MGSDGKTALIHATDKGKKELMKIYSGTWITHNHKKYSKLNYAGDENIVRLLVKNGADLNIANTENNTALVIAITKGT